MSAYTEYASTVKTTPQTQRTPGRTDEVRNSAGGFVFKVNDQQRLERFLVLGTEGGTYYTGQRDLTTQNVDFLVKRIKADERGVVDTIVDVSTNARAYKQSPALFALALVFAFGNGKAHAAEAFNKVVRTSTHLFEFCEYIDKLAGWGRAKRRAVGSFYANKSEDQLALQLAKYRQRNGWTHRDVLRLTHESALSTANAEFALHGLVNPDSSPVLQDFAELQNATTVDEVTRVLNRGRATWEMVPTELLKNADVWKSLFYAGKLEGQALVRNITRLARLSAFDDMQFAADYAAKLVDEDMLRRTRLHPVNLLNAAVVYDEGQVNRHGGYWWNINRNKDWESTPVISDALDEAFYLSFKTIRPANKRTLIGLDVSGSMSTAASGLELSCAQLSAAVAMTVARSEKQYAVMGFADTFRDLGITPRMKLSEVMRKTTDQNFGGTDCALPMQYALERKIKVDTFVVLTDSETWAGKIKPAQALRKYRNTMGIPARLVVLGAAATDFTIADENDGGMLDLCGADASTPNVLADFSAGRI